MEIISTELSLEHTSKNSKDKVDVGVGTHLDNNIYSKVLAIENNNVLLCI
jgi:hypothetical protein